MAPVVKDRHCPARLVTARTASRPQPTVSTLGASTGVWWADLRACGPSVPDGWVITMSTLGTYLAVSTRHWMYPDVGRGWAVRCCFSIKPQVSGLGESIDG